MRVTATVLLVLLAACGEDSERPDTATNDTAADGADTSVTPDDTGVTDTGTPETADTTDTKLPPDTTPPDGDTGGCDEDCAALAGPCQTGACVGTGCVFTARDGACDDGDPCTLNDQCAGELCLGTAKDCGPAPGACATVACDPDDGECVVDSECPGDSVCTASGCQCATPTLLTIELTDIWGQDLGVAQGNLEARDGGTVLGTGPLVTVSLCRATSLAITATAPNHHGASLTLTWNGAEAAVTTAPSRDFAWTLHHEDGSPTLVIGLAHHWFAPTGPPARRGNRLELLMNGEEAWRRVHGDLMAASSLITGASWWWTSEIEIIRDRANGNSLSSAARWSNTILGALELKTNVDRKVLVNQFLSQDGWFSGLTVDDELVAKGKSRGDRFDFLGQANTTSGRFTVALAAVDLASRLGVTATASAPLLPLIGPVQVDTREIPLGLSLLDIPIASWHQKFWTIDQRVAFIGGMNAKTTDWDTIEHRVFDALRMEFDATRAEREEVMRKEEEPDFGPRKDYMVRIDGPSAIDAVEVFHERWEDLITAGVTHAENADPFPLLRAPNPHADGLQAQVLATMPAPYSEYSILESMLRAISQAERLIYIEDQYFRAPILYDAIVNRMNAVPGLVLIVVTNPVSEWTDPGCWQTALAYDRFVRQFPNRFRTYKLQAYDVVRTNCTFCFDETEAHFVRMDLHSKLVIIDDVYLQTGSCNSNNRGLLYEGELAVATHDPAFVSAARHRIVNHLLGTPGAAPIDSTQLIARLDAAAALNVAAFDRWDDEGMDLDLDGDPIPSGMTPKGLVYPLTFDEPDECLLEDVGPDVM